MLEFPHHPGRTQALVKVLESEGFVIEAGTGREYYLIRAVKETGTSKVVVDMDDEFNVDMEYFPEKSQEEPSHTARFTSVSEAGVMQSVVSYVQGFTG